CSSGPSVGCSPTCKGSPASASNGWSALSLGLAVWYSSMPAAKSAALSSTRPTASPGGSSLDSPYSPPQQRGPVLLAKLNPDCTPIEQAFSKVKASLRGLGARTQEALQQAVRLAIAASTPDDAAAWFAHAGYPLSAQDT